jgi:hypothetical protein
LEKAEYTVEEGLKLTEDYLSIIEYQLKKIEDKAYDAAEALMLIGQQMTATAQQSDVYKAGIAELLEASGL